MTEDATPDSQLLLAYLRAHRAARWGQMGARKVSGGPNRGAQVWPALDLTEEAEFLHGIRE